MWGGRQCCLEKIVSDRFVAMALPLALLARAPFTTHGSARSIRAAQTLNSGILLVGSSAGFVRRFADCSPAQ
jgi:hypothetical protein